MDFPHVLSKEKHKEIRKAQKEHCAEHQEVLVKVFYN